MTIQNYKIDVPKKVDDNVLTWNFRQKMKEPPFVDISFDEDKATYPFLFDTGHHGGQASH